MLIRDGTAVLHYTGMVLLCIYLPTYLFPSYPIPCREVCGVCMYVCTYMATCIHVGKEDAFRMILSELDWTGLN